MQGSLRARARRCEPLLNVQLILEGEKLMAKRNVRYPHTIGFRVTDETWFRIVQEVAETDLTPHDWCRLAVLIGSSMNTVSQRRSDFYSRLLCVLNSSLHSVFRCSRMTLLPLTSGRSFVPMQREKPTTFSNKRSRISAHGCRTTKSSCEIETPLILSGYRHSRTRIPAVRKGRSRLLKLAAGLADHVWSLEEIALLAN